MLDVIFINDVFYVKYLVYDMVWNWKELNYYICILFKVLMDVIVWLKFKFDVLFFKNMLCVM